MIRATSITASRAASRLIDDRKCGCHDTKALELRAHAAKAHLVDAIVKLVEIASFTESAAAGPLMDCRMALSSLEAGDE